MGLHNDIGRIKTKMKEKGMALIDVVDIKEIREFEQRYNVMLPEELVLFYTMISNGCEMIDIGCGQTWNIIVCGKEYGKMWNCTDVGIAPAAPELSSLEWFEFWLDGGEDYFNGEGCYAIG